MAADEPIVGPLTEEQARAIADQRARGVYRDLSIYDVSATLADGLWYVDYELKDPESLGGGPHFVISAETGEVVGRRFEQ